MAELTAIISGEDPDELGVELAFSLGPFSLLSNSMF